MIDINNINGSILSYKIDKSKLISGNIDLEYIYKGISNKPEEIIDNNIYMSFSEYINNLNEIKDNLNNENPDIKEIDFYRIEYLNYLYNKKDKNYFKFTTELQRNKDVVYSKEDCIKIQNIFNTNE